MGTNFYVKNKKCPACGHTPTEIHLGKSSYGWQFTFQWNGGQYYKNVDEMRKWLKGKLIKDEYGGKISYLAFWRMVKDKQKPEFKNHAEYMHKQYPDSAHSDFIIDGYSFTDSEFS